MCMRSKNEVKDTSANHCATSFKVLVVSPRFEGKPLLQRHRLVNSCLAEELKEIHAFEQKTLTPEQWLKENQK
ncbi:bolA-like protein 2 isoform X2 [Rhinatrema bivittatum]|uniref:bolA-like protein 2 isoform X2 n=1 Tax=Rhinatrema bivittatum TaxID=194408 RepID=UPI00112BCD7B|nr:bolA-like protein 2 isoform X2 [Rhinatrema bivittatum]